MSALADFLLSAIAEDKQAALRALAGSPMLREGEPAPWRQRYHKVEQHDEVTPEGDILRKTHVADCGPSNVFPARHIVTWQPKRALAECDAKRRILERHRPRVAQEGPHESALICGCSDGSDEFLAVSWPCADVRDIASVYSGRPGYRPEWRTE